MNKEYLKNLIDLLLRIDSVEEMEGFLSGILTPAEIKEIPVRLQIVKLIKQGMPHREIAEKLGVGVATVTRGSREVQAGRFSTVTSSSM